MSSMKKIKKMIIAAVLVCSAMLLAGCGGGNGNGEGNSNSGEKEYSVTVKDALGNAYGSDVLVRFMQDGKQAAIQPCDENGTAAKTLALGTYEIELKFTDSSKTIHYEAGVTVTAENPKTDIVLAYGVSGETRDLYVSLKEHKAYEVAAGCTYVELKKGERSYFLFTPTEAGTYEFSVSCDADTVIGYYGAPHFVQEVSSAELKDGKFTVSIQKSMIGTGDTGTTVLVLGVDAMEDTKGGTICISRIGDPAATIEDLPWDIYQAKAEISKYTVAAGTKIKDFDITASGYTVVYNENDGFYHLNTADGPLVVVYLAKDPANGYLPCFKTILDKSGVNKYFFDENGECIKKETYNECLLQYVENADEATGVYPLTEDLKYIIQSRGEYAGWWNKDSINYIFKDSAGMPIAGLNTEIAWLFMCGYIE